MNAIDGSAIPRLERGVRLRVDKVNNKHLLLRPEQGFELRGSALAIVRLCDGQRSVNDIVAELSVAFREAPVTTIADDVRALVHTLVARRLMVLAEAAS